MRTILLAGATALTMAGCTTAGNAGVVVPEVDQDYVDKVEKSARLGGAQVMWVARPAKKPATTTN